MHGTQAHEGMDSGNWRASSDEGNDPWSPPTMPSGAPAYWNSELHRSSSLYRPISRPSPSLPQHSSAEGLYATSMLPAYSLYLPTYRPSSSAHTPPASLDTAPADVWGVHGNTYYCEGHPGSPQNFTTRPRKFVHLTPPAVFAALVDARLGASS